MMLDIFSSFDPATNCVTYVSPIVFWITLFSTIIIISGSIWIPPSSPAWIFLFIVNVMNTQATRTSGLYIKGFNALLRALFILIIMINFIGLVPYTFSFSSHLLFTLSYGLPLWLALILSAILHNTSSWAAALLPGGAPDWLNPFLVIIETISISVRPITLSFRLAANIRAGHIVLALIGIYAARRIILRFSTAVILISIQIIYIIFEIGICIIQAYIFCLLLSLYADDHPL